MTRWLSAFACAALLAAPLLARAGQAPADQTPVFRTGVEIARLDARVLDGAGRPVKDVRQDEVTVLENGQPRPVVFFQHVDEPDAPYVEVASRTIGSEVSTNRGAPRGHLYVLVFDQQHITAGNEQRARLAAERFLRTRIRPGDRVALAAFPGPGPRLTFSADVERAIAELPKVRGDLERTGIGALGSMTTYEARQIIRGNDLVLSQVATRLAAESGTTDTTRTGGAAGRAGGGDSYSTQLVREDASTIARREDERARQFLLALTALLRDLEGIEGRKAVVLVSEGFFVDNVSRDLERAAAAAARAHGVVYALDLNRRSDTLRDSGPTGGDTQAEVSSRLESIGGLAAETDGALFVDATSHMDDVFDRVAAESQDYYLVGFEPSAAALGNRAAYRRVSVSVRRRGVTVKARSGYALEPDTPSPADRRRGIDVALRAPFPQQGLPVEFTTYTLGGGSDARQRVVLSLEADLPIASPDARAADVVFVVKDAVDGRVAASGTDVMPLPDAPASDKATGRGAYKVQFDLGAGQYLMRVVVREPGGVMGSADRRFEVRALGAGDVTASDLVFGSEHGLAVRPTGHAGDVLPGVVEVYGPTERALADLRVRLAVAPVGQSPTLEMDGDPMPATLTDRGFVRPVQVDLPLDGLAPGQYVARGVVTAGGRIVAELSREIEVLAGPPAAPSARPTTGAGATDPRLVDPRSVLDGAVAKATLDRARLAAAAAGLATDAFGIAASAGWDRLDGGIEPATGAAPSGQRLLAGMARFARRDFTGALEAWEPVLSDEDAGVAFLAGWAHAMAGDDREAIGAWRHAVQLDPTLVSAYLAIADACVRLDSPGLAVQALRAGLAALPDSPELAERLARLERP
ncbi:MAG: VWA domain-containing protein [Vicinamibacterales bacterium]